MTHWTARVARWMLVGTTIGVLACSSDVPGPNGGAGRSGTGGSAGAVIGGGSGGATTGLGGNSGSAAGGSAATSAASGNPGTAGSGIGGSGFAGSGSSGFAGSGGSGFAGSGGSGFAGSSGVGGSAGLGGSTPTAGSGGRPGAGSGGTSAGSGGVSGSAGSASGSGGMTAGAGGTQFTPPFILGADISSVQESNRTYRDTDGQTKSIFDLLKNHGFNYIRLKAFVNPTAPYGYASTANGCPGFPQAFGDRDHVVAFGRLAKLAGMGFLLDFHYSDVWADPGNQIIPQAWRGASSITALAALVKAYTKDVLTTAINAGARPDMVQIGNETTPGMLMHVPGASTDCYGNNPVSAPIGGSTSNWNNLAALLTAGIQGVREVDPRIQIMLHIENTDDLAGVRWWVDNALSRGVAFDVLGLSCYTAFQGAPSVWQSTFSDLATRYPALKFAIAEYNPERTQANLIMKNLPNGRGLGTFFWEPTRSGEWGSAMFTFQGNVGVANSADFAAYDALRPQLGL